ncbi:MAG: hypothetical protein KC463_07395 [Streptococcus sp.]|nr:hypothetical protein [Streptococcus sp.]
MNISYSVTEAIEEKILIRHRVHLYEVDEALEDEALVRRRIKKDRKRQEVIYKFIGETLSGRLLQIYLIFKVDGTWLMSAYDGDKADRSLYNQNR